MTYPIIQTDRTPLIDSESYESMYESSMNEPEVFWAEQADTFIDWEKKWDKVSDVDFTKGKIAWFEGATLNVSYNCIDRHLPERANQVAIIWEGDDPNSSESITYSQLHEKVCKFSNGLKELLRFFLNHYIITFSIYRDLGEFFSNFTYFRFF